MIDKFVQQQEQAGDHADDDDDDDDEKDEDDDDVDDVESHDRDSCDNGNVIKATSGADDSLPAGDVKQPSVDDAGYEWSVNISSSESEDEASTTGFCQVRHFFIP